MQNIRATNFYEYVKCPRKVYMNFFGDHDKKQPYSEFMQEKFQEGRDFEEQIANELEFKQPDDELSYPDAFKQTVDLMKNKADMIYQGILLHENLIGIPDFLEKKKGKSNFGNYYYQVCDVKSGLSAKPEYIMQVTFYSYMLEQIQGYMPPKACLILGNKSKIEISIIDYLPRFSKMFQRIKEIRAGAEEKVHIAGVCKECVWKDVCFETAEKEGNISLIYNLSRSKIEKLKTIKVRTLKDAANLDIQKAIQLPRFTENSAKRIRLQAQSLLQKKAIKLKETKLSKDKPIFFDIEDTETEAGKKVIYLFGLVEDGKYTHFTAKDPKEESQIWKKFLNYFDTKDEFKIYVYSSHEKSMLNKLYAKYGGNKYTFDNIINNIVDLLPMLKDTAVLPIYSYSIKDAAKFLGFNWASNDAGGMQSLIWYDKWLETKDKKYLNTLLQYNEDDCRAMIVIKDFFR